MKKIILAVSAAAVLGLAFFISGCSASPHESFKDAVGLSDASVGDIIVFGDIRWYVIAKTKTGYTLLSEKPVIKMPFNEAGHKNNRHMGQFHSKSLAKRKVLQHIHRRGEISDCKNAQYQFRQ